ncbi:MAG: FHA domain-containing protein, partial [Oscillospiraceae bacterium]|nr:FHA domain-containing protein [Oscillospiraceae bacterium]
GFTGVTGGEEKTVGIYKKTKGIDPVTGWLVCVGGDERGRDYRLHTGRNFVGRSYKMQICIADDPEVSRENHCSVVFEPIKSVFMLVPGTGTATYLNGERLDGALVIKKGDMIQIGGSQMEFIPYCGEGKNWDTK